MPAQSQTPEPAPACQNAACGCKTKPLVGPWMSADIQSTANGTCVSARQYSAYYTYSTDATVCRECISVPLKSGKTLSIGWARLGGQEARESAYKDTWMPGGAGGVFSFLPRLTYYTYDPAGSQRIYSNPSSLSFDSGNLPQAQMPIAAKRDATYFTTYEQVSGVYFEYFGGGLPSTDRMYGRVNRRYDIQGNELQYRYDPNPQGKMLLSRFEAFGGDFGDIIPYFYYADQNIDATRFAPITSIVLYDQATPDRRTVYFEYQNYTDPVTGNVNPYLSRIIKPDGCTDLYNPVIPFNDITDAYQIKRDVDAEGYQTYFNYTGGSLNQVAEPEGRITYYEYPFQGETRQIQQGRAKRFLLYSLNSTGDQLTQVTQHTDPLGNSTYFTYDQTLGRMTKKIDPNGNLTYYEYVGGSAANKYAASRQVRAFDNAATYFGYSGETYDLAKQVGPRQTSTFSAATYYRYDASRNRTAMVDALGNETQMGPNSRGQTIRQKDARGNTTYFNYGSARGSLDSQFDALGNVAYFAYDTFLNPTAQVSPRWKEQNSFLPFTTYYVYDQLNRRTKMIDAKGSVTYYDYTSRGDLLDTVDPLETQTAYTYNGLHLRTQTTVTGRTGAVLSQTKDGYDQYKNRTKTRDGLGNATYFFYDQVDRLTAQKDALSNTTYFYYDSMGNRTVQTDARNNSAYYFYDQVSRNTVTRDALANATYYFYDVADNQVSQVDPRGNAAYFFYDALNRRQATRDALANPTYYFYDPVGSQSVVRNARFNSTYFGYDALNRRSKTQDALANTTYYFYDAAGNQTHVTDARLGTTYFFYDTLNRPSITRDALANPTYFFYDKVGNQTVRMNPRFASTYFGYDGLKRQTQMQDALANTTYFVYDVVGNRTRITDARGNSSYFAYDALNRQTLVEDALGIATLFQYDQVGNPTAVDRGAYGYGLQPYGTSPYGGQDGATTYFFYDSLNRRSATRDALAGFTYFFYDQGSNLTAVRNPLLHPTYFGYDQLNRQVRMQDALAATTYFEYDAVGNRTKVIDPDAHATQTRYDKLDRPDAMLYPDTGATYYFYDQVSNRTRDLDPRGNTTYYGYDALNRSARIQDALGKSVYFEYDAAGNRSKVIDAEKAQTAYTYDLVNRLTDITYTTAGVIVSDGLKSTYYVYDPVGNATQMGDLWGLHRMGYDAGNRLTQHQYPNSNVVYYRYDTRHNVTSRVYPGSAGTSKADYDSLDRQTKIQAPSGATAYFTYDAASNLTKRLLGNNAKLDVTYDAAERAQVWRYSKSNAAPLTYFDYTRDTKGLVTKAVREATYTTYYTYDANDRLASEVWGSGGSEVYGYRYSYDVAGNRTKARVNGSDTYYSYDSANQLTKKGTNAVFASPTYYTYDQNGSLTDLVEPSGTTKFAYNAAGLVARMRWKDASTTYFYYDGTLQRYALNQNGTINYFVWDREDLLQELNADGTVKEEYTQAKSPITGIGQLVETNRPGVSPQMIYPVMDPRGTITKWVQSDGTTVVASREYDAFGNLIPNAAVGTWPGIFGYQGQAWTEIKSADSAQRLLLSPTRLYDPADGHFLSRDPLRLADPTAAPHLIQPAYLYVVQSPIIQVDRDGMVITSLYDSRMTGNGWRSLSPQTGLGMNIVNYGAPFGQPNVNTVITNPASNNFVYQPVFRSGETPPSGGFGNGGVFANWAINAALGTLIGSIPVGCNYYNLAVTPTCYAEFHNVGVGIWQQTITTPNFGNPAIWAEATTSAPDSVTSIVMGTPVWNAFLNDTPFEKPAQSGLANLLPAPPALAYKPPPPAVKVERSWWYGAGWTVPDDTNKVGFWYQFQADITCNYSSSPSKTVHLVIHIQDSGAPPKKVDPPAWNNTSKARPPVYFDRK